MLPVLLYRAPPWFQSVQAPPQKCVRNLKFFTTRANGKLFLHNCSFLLINHSCILIYKTAYGLLKLYISIFTLLKYNKNFRKGHVFLKTSPKLLQGKGSIEFLKKLRAAISLKAPLSPWKATLFFNLLTSFIDLPIHRLVN